MSCSPKPSTSGSRLALKLQGNVPLLGDGSFKDPPSLTGRLPKWLKSTTPVIMSSPSETGQEEVPTPKVPSITAANMAPRANAEGPAAVRGEEARAPEDAVETAFTGACGFALSSGRTTLGGTTCCAAEGMPCSLGVSNVGDGNCQSQALEPQLSSHDQSDQVQEGSYHDHSSTSAPTDQSPLQSSEVS